VVSRRGRLLLFFSAFSRGHFRCRSVMIFVRPISLRTVPIFARPPSLFSVMIFAQPFSLSFSDDFRATTFAVVRSRGHLLFFSADFRAAASTVIHSGFPRGHFCCHSVMVFARLPLSFSADIRGCAAPSFFGSFSSDFFNVTFPLPATFFLSDSSLRLFRTNLACRSSPFHESVQRYRRLRKRVRGGDGRAPPAPVCLAWPDAGTTLLIHCGCRERSLNVLSRIPTHTNFISMTLSCGFRGNPQI
jgi:hypothetical protein